MADEFIDVIDESDQVVGRERKSVVHRRGLGHRVSALLLWREDGRCLITTAAPTKVEAGRLYHSAAGHVLSGESYREAARRELLEETGLAIQNVEYQGSYWFEKEYASRRERERFEVYTAGYDESMGPVTLNEEHVRERWLSEEDLRLIYTKEPEAMSAPLRRTCRLVFGWGD